MGSEHLATLEKADFNATKAKIQETTTIYKGIERLCGDLTLLRKKVEDYRSAISAHLALKKDASYAAIE